MSQYCSICESSVVVGIIVTKWTNDHEQEIIEFRCKRHLNNLPTSQVKD